MAQASGGEVVGTGRGRDEIKSYRRGIASCDVDVDVLKNIVLNSWSSRIFESSTHCAVRAQSRFQCATRDSQRMKDGVSAGVRHVDPVLRRACLAAALLHSSPPAPLPLHVDGGSVPTASATTASTQETLFNPHGVRVTAIVVNASGYQPRGTGLDFQLISWTAAGAMEMKVSEWVGRGKRYMAGGGEWIHMGVTTGPKRNGTTRVSEGVVGSCKSVRQSVSVVTLLTCLVACSQGGLLSVPRVYNALITSNERLLPSRAYPVSSPLLAFYPVITDPYLALHPEGRYLVAPPSAPGDGTPAPESGDLPLPPPLLPPHLPPPPPPRKLTPPPFPPLSYSPFSYYPSFLSYSYFPGYEAFPLTAGHEKQTPTVPGPEDSVKNNKPKENSAIPDVLPPSPSGGTAAPSEEGKDSAPVKAS
uniref:Uncharacterized protein n=1 Tax=Timema genevievae TaxID=629358 RepID=A0A7R9PMP6_TIMGE|nr:unnamed protein product [Timema genevievae]